MRVAVHVFGIIAVMYAIGWGPTLAIGLIFGAVESIRLSGVRGHPRDRGDSVLMLVEHVLDPSRCRPSIVVVIPLGFVRVVRVGIDFGSRMQNHGLPLITMSGAREHAQAAARINDMCEKETSNTLYRALSAAHYRVIAATHSRA